jgi:hypothetical protein
MATNTDTDDDSLTFVEYRRMDEAEARSQLTVDQFEEWQAVNDQLDEHEQALDRWDDTREEATDVLVRTDPSAYAADVTVWGNDLSVYYAPDDPRLRETVEGLADVFDIDAEDAAEGDIDDIHAEDVAAEDVDTAKGVLADLVCLACQTWNGTAWDDLGDADRQAIRDALVTDPPDGWGLAGLMDAWTEIQVAVEDARTERLERVEKFRNPRRRGNR